MTDQALGSAHPYDIVARRDLESLPPLAIRLVSSTPSLIMKPYLHYLLPLLPLLPFVAGCSSTPGGGFLLSPYRIDVRQGNFVTQEMVSRLKPGQTRDQVRFILGSPLVTDVFHADRWDYVYRFQPGRGEPSERRVTVFFENNLLSRVAGDVTSSQDAIERPVTRVIEIDKPLAAGDEKKAGAQ